MRARAGVVGWVLVVSALLAGCGGDEEPAPQPSMARPTVVTPTDSPSATRTGTGTAGSGPVLPKPARAHTYAGADAFARFYFVQVNKAWMTPDPGEVRSLSSEGCRTCEVYLKTAKALQAAGQRYDREAVTIRASAWLPESTPSRSVVQLALTQEPARIINTQGKTVAHDRTVRLNIRCELVWSNGRWTVDRVQQVVFK